MMGAECTTANAERMIEMLNHFKIDDIDQICEADWFQLVAEACEENK